MGTPKPGILPDANNIPAGFATVGSKFDFFRTKSPLGNLWGPGAVVFNYPNDQAASTLWYHDHTLGMTRLNVYAGPAGFFILRGGCFDLPSGVLPGPAPKRGDPAGKKYYEIPIAIQDRSFNADGSLFYPVDRAFFQDEGFEPDGFTGPFIPDSDISPIWNPEFFGNMMVVNGKTWPVLKVEPRKYRFRFLDGCNSRFLKLRIVAADPATGDAPLVRPVASALPFWQIGAEGGFLPSVVQVDQLLMSPAERADCIVDFTNLPVGSVFYLINEGTDAPFNGAPADPADPGTTGQVMKFEVVALQTCDLSVPPCSLTKLPSRLVKTTPTVTRRVSLNEMMSMEFGIPAAALLGTVDLTMPGMPMGMHLMWDDPITENPNLNATEVWEIYNFTADAHPIHIHEVMFQVVNREIFSVDSPFYNPSMPNIGLVRPPEATEKGTKDTVIAYPGEITRVKAKFDIPGLFVWPCHIVEHEDNEMMRPYAIGPSPLPAIPTPPSDLKVTGVTSTSISICWKDNSNNEQGFYIESSGDNGMTWTRLGQNGANCTSGTDKPLAPGTTHLYRVQAFNSAGVSVFSNVVSGTTTSSGGCASASNLRTTSVTSTCVALAWNDNSGNETGFRCERATDSGFTANKVSHSVGANITAYNNTSVTPGATYYYRVVAYNGAGSAAPSNVLTVVVPSGGTKPSAPTNLRVTGATTTSISIAWTDTANNEQGFNIERSLNGSAPWTVLGQNPANVTSGRDTPLTSKTTYWYRVNAYNANGVSNYSNVISGTTQ